MDALNLPPVHTDGYKIDHRRQLPEETVLIYDNMTPRKSRIPGVNAVIQFGVQHYLKAILIDEWNTHFFNQLFDEIAYHWTRTLKSYTSPEAAAEVGVEHWRALHKLGYLPLRIKALPEGSKCPIRVPCFTVVSTHDDFAWLPQYIETDMSCFTWPMMTSATSANEYRKIFEKWAMKTVGNIDFVPFQGHDFSYRGMFGREAAIISGAAHLTSFVGTDTIPALPFLEKYYGANLDKELVGCSVWATEHAVMCVGTGFYIRKKNLTWEKYGEAELAVFKRLITEVYPKGIVSIVSDTWDIWQVLLDYCVILKEEILARDGKLVFRPDSGKPDDILCGFHAYKSEVDGKMYHRRDVMDGGYTDAFIEHNPGAKPVTPAERKGVVEVLWDIFGGTLTDKGYRLLDKHVGTIYGDSISTALANEICSRLDKKGFASINWVAGIGSFNYQYVTRDTFGFALKATYAECIIYDEREGIEIFKDPVTDDGTKKSAKGLLQVNQDEEGNYTLKDQVCWEEEAISCLETVFENSKMIKEYTLAEIRERVRS